MCGNDLPTCGCSSFDKLLQWGSWNGEMNVTLKECPSITKAHAAHGTVRSFFYLHSISEHDKQNILNLELMLFHLICRLQVNNCQLQIS